MIILILIISTNGLLGAACLALRAAIRAAARELIQGVFKHVDQLIIYPDSGSKPRELRGGRYRQIVEPPCRIFNRREDETFYVLHVMRGERKLRLRGLAARSKKAVP